MINIIRENFLFLVIFESETWFKKINNFLMEIIQINNEQINNDKQTQIFVKDLKGNTPTITVNLSLTTIKDIKLTIYDKYKIPPESQRLIFKGEQLIDEKTLKECNIVKESTIHLVLSIRGGGFGFEGPNLNSELIQRQWNDNAPEYRTVVKGLNIDFQYNGKNVIGHLGYGKFDIARDYKNAYCPFFNIYCTSMDSINRFSFNNCIVFFDGETSNGEEVKVEVIYDDNYNYYEGFKTYIWLILTVKDTLNNEIDKIDDIDLYI